MEIDLSVNEKYYDRLKKAAAYYDEEDLKSWEKWSDKWSSFDWKDPKDS